jgi:energy-coupling factor transporter ATP-binding protein EcfA2/energy-coupling factor transporter transmembrane protein EcfT
MQQISRHGVQVRNLTWTPFASERPLLKEVSFTVQPGERVLLIGPSGSGKSTLLRAIAGVLTETESGELSGSITSDTSGLLLQDPYDSLVSDQVYREVAFGLENRGVPRSQMPEIVSANLKATNLDKPFWHPSRDMSGGEMQRMAFSGVLAMNADVLLLDEPTSMLDDQSAKSVRTAVKANLDQLGSTLIVVEHRFEDWLPVVDRILVLNGEGRLIHDGDPKSILKSHTDELLALGLWVPGSSTPSLAVKSSTVAGESGITRRGKLTVLTGKSGAGKTTELRRRLMSDPGIETIRAGVGYVPQQAELTIIGSTVLESASLTAKLAAITSDHSVAIAQTRALLQKLNVAELSEANPYEISGGEQRRVALATALAHRPAALYLDEPTVGQDRDSWAAISDAILSAREAGVQITVATHDEDLVRLADEVIQIEPEIVPAIPMTAPAISGLAILIAPLALLAGSMGVTSPLKGSIALGGALLSMIIIGLAGLRFRAAKALIPALVGIVSIGLSNWYLSESQNPATGLTAAMRVSLFIIPGVLLATELRAIPFGDQLGQFLRFPARPVVAAVAAMQRMNALIELWGELRFIHKIRGLKIGKAPWSRLVEFSRLVFALLVQAIRGAAVTAVAMDARGFSSPTSRAPRTWAEAPKRGRLDLLVILLACLTAVAPWLFG